jgi:hypothetical protein
MAVMRTELAFRRGGNEEMRVEALGHHVRRYPAGVADELVGSEAKSIRLQKVGQRQFLRIEIGAERVEGVDILVEQCRASRLARQKDAALLEGLADGAGREREFPRRHRRRRRRSGPVAADRGHPGPAFRPEDQRTRSEIDLVMALYHEDLDPGVAVTDEKDRGRQERS